jgi:hypothetical protein
MIFQYLEQGVLIIDETFNEQDLEKIWEDINIIKEKDLLLDPEFTATARNPSNDEILKNNKGIFIDILFRNNVIKYTPEILNKLFRPSIAKELESIHPALSMFRNINYTITLFSFYSNGGYYKPHWDDSMFTVITWLCPEPKRWTGGMFRLNKFGIEVEPKNNRTIILPGTYVHEVTEIISELDDGINGRYTLSQFAFSKPTIDTSE